MLTIGLLSDTHGYLDARIFEHFADCDEIWHAGDFGNLALAQQLADFKPLRGVYGNIDSADLRAQYPENLRFELEGVEVLMTHIASTPPNYNKRVKALLAQAPKPHLLICGHSHILQVLPDNAHNLLFINPGACGQEGWHKQKTLLKFQLSAGKIHNLQLIELGARGKI
jgi:putative phosphoesterase